MARIEIDQDYMQLYLSCLRRLAQKVVTLDQEMKAENETEPNNHKEAEELVIDALLKAIHRFDTGFELREFDTPESLYEYLFRYVHSLSDDIKTSELIYEGIERATNFIYYEYDRRLNELKISKEPQP
jgi:hypothetical protein